MKHKEFTKHEAFTKTTVTRTASRQMKDYVGWIKPLHQVESTHHGNRLGYLRVKLLEEDWIPQTKKLAYFQCCVSSLPLLVCLILDFEHSHAGLLVLY